MGSYIEQGQMTASNSVNTSTIAFHDTKENMLLFSCLFLAAITFKPWC